MGTKKPTWPRRLAGARAASAGPVHVRRPRRAAQDVSKPRPCGAVCGRRARPSCGSVAAPVYAARGVHGRETAREPELARVPIRHGFKPAKYVSQRRLAPRLASLHPPTQRAETLRCPSNLNHSPTVCATQAYRQRNNSVHNSCLSTLFAHPDPVVACLCSLLCILKYFHQHFGRVERHDQG